MNPGIVSDTSWKRQRSLNKIFLEWGTYLSTALKALVGHVIAPPSSLLSSGQ
jgi:hypothetical protein